MAQAATPQPAMQFDDFAQQHEAAALGMWVFLATEILFFGGLFCAYIIYRFSYPAEWAVGSSHLYFGIGAGNAAVLITSSFTMTIAIRDARHARRGAAVGWLLATALLGCLFIGLKGTEYTLDFHDHLVPVMNFHIANTHGLSIHRIELFFLFYFFMTGLHVIHLSIGVLCVFFLSARVSAGKYLGEEANPVEMVGLYWHFVDSIWLFLLPLLYMVPHP